jgi:hypothetical protein
LTDVSEVLTTFIVKAMIALAMEIVNASETSVYFYEIILHSIAKRCHLNARVKSRTKLITTMAFELNVMYHPLTKLSAAGVP